MMTRHPAGAVRRSRSGAAIVALLLGAPAAGLAQGGDGTAANRPAATAPAPYVPLDDAAYALVDALLARGLLPSLSALDRPYTVAELRAAIDAAPPEASLGRVPRGWLRTLARAAGKHAPPSDDDARPALRVRATLVPIVTAQTGEEREQMLARGDGGAYPGVWARAAGVAGPAVAVLRVRGDLALKHDARYTGKTDRAIAGRVEDGYVAAQWPFGELFFGRQARSWGPHAVSGLLLGRDAFTYDHLQARLGPRRLRLDAIVARLDDVTVPEGQAHRYFTAHRLLGRWRALEVAVSEALVYGGVDRGFQPSLANPLNVYNLAQYNEREAGNVSYALDVAWRPRALGVLSAQVLLDDVQVDDCDPLCKEPASWGSTVSAEGLPLVGDHRLFASYTRVSNLTYRTPQPFERYATLGSGLGRDFSDYDEARAGVDLALLASAPLRAYVAYRRQGEGDFRLPFPAPEDYAATRAFLAGTPMRVLRTAVSGGGAVGWLEVTGDVGYNVVRDAGHERGRREGGIEGRVRVSIESPWAVGGRVAP